MEEDKFNFNLLYPFYILHDEKNVTRAGKRLDVTQSAMSNALNQMRKQFDDQLFIRGKYGMRPTDRATEIATDLEPILDDIDNLINEQKQFDPATTEREFIIATTNVMSNLLFPSLVQEFYKQAPNARLNIQTCNNFIYDQNYNDKHGIELLVGMNCALPTTAYSEPILKIAQVVVGRKDHPLLQDKLTLNKYLKSRHLLVNFTAAYSNFQRRKNNVIDAALTEKGLKRDIALSIHFARIVPTILSNSDLLSVVPEYLFKNFNKRNQFKCAPIPFKVPKVHIHQVWHNRYENDPGHIWLRGLVKKILNKHYNK